MGIRADYRDYKQNYYGGYCNKVRELLLNPIPYYEFSYVIDRLFKEKLTKKQIMEKLIGYTTLKYKGENI